jgi:hypothetical protein
MGCPKVYQISGDSTPCQLKLIGPSGDVVSINLEGAITRPNQDGGFSIYSPNSTSFSSVGGGVSVDLASSFTQADIDALIDACVSARGGAGGNITLNPPANQNVTVIQDDTDDVDPVSPNRIVLQGNQTFSLPANTESVSYGVIQAGTGTSTVQVNNGTTPLFESESGGWSVLKDQHDHLVLPITFTTTGTDVIVINFITT